MKTSNVFANGKRQVAEIPERGYKIDSVVRGWAHTDDKQAAKLIHIVHAERVPGVGPRTTTFWRSTLDWQRQNAGIFERVFGRLLSYSMATLLGLQAEWVDIHRKD